MFQEPPLERIACSVPLFNLQHLFAISRIAQTRWLFIRSERNFSGILEAERQVRPDKEFRAEVARICGTEAMEIPAG